MKQERNRANDKATVAQCLPRQCRWRQSRTSTSTSTSMATATRPAATLLERLREVVIKLIMFSAISRPRRPASAGSRERQQCCNYEDPRRSEAVEDCIEFFRMSSSTEGNTKR
ncbi:hypothetical protein ZIOFF_042965 [Zingiber officinale]|uniref:Uncharacterized protein n=1 Tax=Zingiber officinale TaxID=94328 RepID=A0A8J5KTR6_ZINOF|nr:hypothetical protein ZIOFF_042965 [Zingiber officinale]